MLMTLPAGRRRSPRLLPALLATLALALSTTTVAATRGNATAVSSFGAVVSQDNLQRQFLVKNGRVYRRSESNWNLWESIDTGLNGTAQVGVGEITGFSAEVYQDGLQRQFLTRGGQVYRRTQQANTAWGAWEDITSVFATAGQGRITAFNVAVYKDNLQRQFLVRAGQVYRRTQLANNGWSGWDNLTSLFAGVGGNAVITSFSASLYQDNVLRQFLVKGNKVYRRLETDLNTWQEISPIFAPVGRSPNPRVAEPIHRRVMVLEFNPVIESHGSRRLNDVMGWRNPLVLEDQYTRYLESASSQVVQYTVAQRVRLDQFPSRTDGTVYTDDQYIACFRAKTCNERETLNYRKVLTDHRVCEKFNAGEIDELWLWGGPFFGYWEANMAGTGAFDTNGAVVTGTTCQGKLNIMGFNYEREPERMLEDMGHRVEGTMVHLFGGVWRNGYLKLPNPFPANANVFERFTARGFDNTTAACGNIHGSLNTPVYDRINNAWGYDFTNPNLERNTCDDWDRYPNLTGATTTNNCTRWGCNDLGWHTYWLSKIPKYVGTHNGLHNNWWVYMLDWDAVVPQ